MKRNHQTNELLTAVRRPRMIVAAAVFAALAARSLPSTPPATHAAQVEEAR